MSKLRPLSTLLVSLCLLASGCGQVAEIRIRRATLEVDADGKTTARATISCFGSGSEECEATTYCLEAVEAQKELICSSKRVQKEPETEELLVLSFQTNPPAKRANLKVKRMDGTYLDGATVSDQEPYSGGW